MTAYSDIPTKGLLKILPDRFMFNCPGCKTIHNIGLSWQFNKNYDAPTFSPSVLVSYPNKPKSFYCCHSFIRDGKIEFLNDCTHSLAGQTIQMPSWEDEERSIT